MTDVISALILGCVSLGPFLGSAAMEILIHKYSNNKEK